MERFLFSLSLLKGFITFYCSTADQAPEDFPFVQIYKHETEAIVVAPDGMVSLVDIDSGDILWSFSSGGAIYSSYQQGENLNEGYVDCGDDWKLYFHKDGQKRLIPVEALAPFTCTNGTMIASKNISTFHVKPKTGEVVRTYTDNVSLVEGNSSLSRSYEGRVPTRSMDNEVLFFVTRTDYTIKYTCNSGEVLWGVMFADVDVSYLFQSNEMEERLFQPSMDCQKKPVCRLRVGSPLASYFVAETPQAALPQSEAASTSASASNHRKIPVDLLPAFQLAVARWIRNAANKEKKSKKAQSGQEKQEDSIRFSNDTNANGRVINNNLIVTDEEIAKGSNGTIVFEGEHQKRPAAVKRLPKTAHNLAVKETDHLIASDRHVNIVSCYGVEYDEEFDYICLERCLCSLYDLILNKAGNRNACELWEDGLRLWEDGFPSEELLKLMRGIASGVAHMHKLRIVHRDLKPQDILIIKYPFTEDPFTAKISDMGMSEKLDENKLYLTEHATGRGSSRRRAKKVLRNESQSSGWQAKEVLNNEPQTDAVDLFSLGCILFFCMTNGQHPFGEDPQRDDNIRKDNKSMSLIKKFPEASDLISGLLQFDPNSRTRAKDVIHHPLFWSSDTRMSFFRDVSNEVKFRNSQLTNKLEKIRLGTKWWEGKIDKNLLADRLKHRKYNFKSVRDLLRLIRNTVNHDDEHSEESRKILGQFPEGVDKYFSSQFRNLLIDVYKVILEHCSKEERFSKYFSGGM